jgi:hypothetical protein
LRSPLQDRASSATYSNVQPSPSVTPDNQNSKNDLEKIVQLVIDMPELQRYYHADAVANRKPFYILKNELISEEMSLSKFGEPISLLPVMN